MDFRRRLSVITLVTLALSTACGGAGSAGSSATSPRPSAAGSSAATTTAATSSASPAGCPAPPPPSALPATLAADFPTALAFAPDGRLFVAERAGRIRVWEGGTDRVFATVATVTTEPGGGYSERGLLGLALSPTFPRDHFVYAFYSDADRVHQRVIRWSDCGGVGVAPTLLVTLPAGGDCCHKGGRLAFGPDSKLYVTLGDEHDAAAAQDLHDVRGKVLRYDPDGSVPPDGPFGPGNPVYAYGLRNPFGIAVGPPGQLAVTDNGPTGDAGSPSTGYDRIVLSVERGGGYQWPLCYGYSHPLAAVGCGGQHQPDWSSEEQTVVPTGATFVDASGPVPYAGHLVVCTYDRGMLVVTPGAPHAGVAQGPSACRLDVAQAPDGSLWVADTAAVIRVG